MLVTFQILKFWGVTEELQGDKCFFALWAPFELGFLLSELGHRLGDLGEVWDEWAIISR
jgi:hypothetical protein